MPAQDVFRATHFNGSASVAGDKVATNKGLGVRLIIRNVDAAEDLEISFNGGRTFFTVGGPGASLDLPVRFHFFFVRGSGGVADFEALILEG